MTPLARLDEPRQGRFWPLALVSLLLLPVAAWVGAYFFINSSTGRAAMQQWLTRRAPDERVQVASVHWGPAPTTFELVDARVVDDSGRPLIHAEHVRGTLTLGALFDGDLSFETIKVDGFVLHLAWDADGKLNIAKALARKDKDPDKAPTDKPKRPFDLGSIELMRGDVTLEWPAWGMQFQAVNATGHVGRDRVDGLVIDANLSGGSAFALWDRERHRVDFEHVDIGGFRWQDGGFVTEQLLLRAADSKVDLAGKMRFAGEVTLEAKGDALLSPRLTAALLPGWLPRGGALRGFKAAIAGGALTGSIDHARAAEVTAGPVKVSAVDLPVEAFRYVPGLLRPQGSLRVRNATAGALEAPNGLSASELAIGSLVMTIRGKANADFQGVTAAAVSLPEGDVGPARAHGSITVGVTGGSIQGTLETEQGKVGTSGKIRVNPFTRKVTVEVKVAFEDIVKNIAMNLTSALPADMRGALAPPINGFATFETKLQRKKIDGKKRWVAESTVTDAQLTGGERVIFDGHTWTRGAADRATP